MDEQSTAYAMNTAHLNVTRQFPKEFEPAFYRARYDGLASFDDGALKAHYERVGRGEGRLASPAAVRENFVPLFDGIRPVLEIGPFDRPMVKGVGVSYFDVLDRDALVERARTTNRHGEIPFIEFVSAKGDLSIVDRKFAAVCSAHCIEHQPDLISHLLHVGRVLDDGGFYFLAAPDKRFSFDHFIPPSTVADVIEAQEARHTVHTLANVIRQMGLSTHNEAPRHWNGIHAEPGYAGQIPARIKRAIALYRESAGNYIDVHAWRFTPASFRAMISTLSELGLIPFRVARVYDTPRPRLEFMAILEKLPER